MLAMTGNQRFVILAYVQPTWRKKFRGGLVRGLKKAKGTHGEAVVNSHKSKDIPHYRRTTGTTHHYVLPLRYGMP